MMNAQTSTLEISSSVSVSCDYLIPEAATGVITLAHGAGAGMNHSFMVNLAKSLAEERIATLRFNFPFAEQKKGRPDLPAVAHKAVEAAISKTHTLFPSLPLFAAGKSFGGRMSSQFLSKHFDTPVKGIIFYGFPLHPPGKPSVERAEHLKDVKVPMLFLQGTRDELAEWSLIESVCATLPLAKLVKIEGADHSFKAGKKDIMQILVTATRDWVERIINKHQ
jgi:predicted alpha/beta-hydrolase family hydrolase